MADSAHDELARCVIQLLFKEPFFGHLLGSVVRAVDERTPTACVSREGTRVTLTVNPVFFMKKIRKGPERVAIVKHEALHILFKHLFRYERTRHDALVFNVAADIVVNQFIGSPWKLPDDAVTLATFPDLGLERDKSVEWYYERLIVLAEKLGKTKQTAEQAPGNGGDAPKSTEAMRRLLEGAVWHSDHGRWGG
jgi:predicted metal-dependent peptidase